jgi:hypothetical protein
MSEYTKGEYMSEVHYIILIDSTQKKQLDFNKKNKTSRIWSSKTWFVGVVTLGSVLIGDMQCE